MRRRTSQQRVQQPARHWTSADLPPQLAEFSADEWGCQLEHNHLRERCKPYRDWSRARRQWYLDHDVNVLQESRDEAAATRRSWTGPERDGVS